MQTTDRVTRQGEGHDCPVCSTPRARVFFENLGVPVHCNVLPRSRDEALDVPRGDIRLAFCDRCGMVWNLEFREDLLGYTADYENSLHFSPRFQAYAEDLVDHLTDAFDLRGKHVVEIGCGKGEFLTMLCQASGSRGTGFDASFEGDPGSGVRVVREMFSEAHTGIAPDLVVCRHVLEHIARPRDFLRLVKATAAGRGNGGVFFEVPNSLFILEDHSIWDIIYEHCSYFVSTSLATLFREAGFDVSSVYPAYERQFLCLEAGNGVAPGAIDLEDPSRVSELVEGFEQAYGAKTREWEAILDRCRGAGERAIVWGAGSKGVTFLNSLENASTVELVVDINERKQGAYVPGSGQEIVPPGALRDVRPDRVIIMNPIYVDEIERTLHGLGLETDRLMVAA